MLSENKIKDFEAKIEYTFKDKDLLELALSHSSYVNELTVRNRQCNERVPEGIPERIDLRSRNGKCFR